MNSPSIKAFVDKYGIDYEVNENEIISKAMKECLSVEGEGNIFEIIGVDSEEIFG